MAWSSETTENKTNLTQTEQVSANIALNPGETAHVEVDANFIASPTDDILVRVYGSIDGTNYDDSPVFGMRIDKDVDPNQISFIVRGYKSFRIALLMNGGTDTTSDADINWILDGVSL